MVLSIPIQHPSTPPSLFPPNCSSASEICWNAKGLIIFMCHLNIKKHRPWAYILGFIELPYFGSEQFRKIYLVERICICICIWINVFVFVFVFESMLNKIFVFVFVFEKSKFLYLYLYLYLIKRIWPQPWTGDDLQIKNLYWKQKITTVHWIIYFTLIVFFLVLWMTTYTSESTVVNGTD